LNKKLLLNFSSKNIYILDFENIFIVTAGTFVF
jgi:hypothetical protein